MRNFLKDVRVLVTGGAGAIGGHVVRTLLARQAVVTVVDDLTSGRLSNLPSDDSRLEVVVTSILDPDVESLFLAGQDVVIHLAAKFANQNSIDFPDEDLRVNAGGTLRMLELCRSYPVRKFVYSSTSCVTSLNTPYAISKLTGEKYAQFYREQHGVPVNVVRYFNSYGPHDYPGQYRSVVPNFFALAMAGKPLPVLGSGKETRDFTYVEDLAEATVRATEVADHGHVLELGAGLSVEILHLANLINAVTQNTAGIAYQPRRNWDTVLDRRADTEQAANVLQYVPSTPIETGIWHTYDWMKRIDVQR